MIEIAELFLTILFGAIIGVSLMLMVAKKVFNGRIEHLSKMIDRYPRHYNVIVGTLPEDEEYILTKPINIHITESPDGDFMASYYDACMHMSGENDQLAVDNLISFMCDCYDDYRKMKPEQLSPYIQRNKCVLSQILKPIGDSK